MLGCLAAILTSVAFALGAGGAGVVPQDAAPPVAQDDAVQAAQDDLAQAFENAYGKIIREIRLVGLKRTKEFIVLRELGSKVGEPFTEENARKDPDRLKTRTTRSSSSFT